MPASPSPWPAPYVALKATKEQGTLTAVLCVSQSHPESQRLRTALRWTSEEAKRMGVQFTELTAESNADQLRALNVKIYPTLIVYRRSADGQRLELADALKGAYDPVSVFQWLKTIAQNQYGQGSRDTGLKRVGVGPNTFVPAASRAANPASAEHRASPIIASQTAAPAPPFSEPTPPTLINGPDDNSAAPSVPTLTPAPGGASPLRLAPEIIADAGQPQIPNPDSEAAQAPPAPQLNPPPPEAETNPAPPPRSPVPEPNGESPPPAQPAEEPQPNPEPNPAPAPPPAPVPEAADAPAQPADAEQQPQTRPQPQPRTMYGSGIDDPRYQTPPHLVGRGNAQPHSHVAPAGQAPAMVTATPQSSPDAKSTPWLMSAFGHKHSAAVSSPPPSSQAQRPSASTIRPESITVPALPSSPAPEHSHSHPPGATASPQSSLVYRQAPCPPAAPPPQGPECEIPRCLIVQVPAVYCQPAGGASAPAPAQLFLAVPAAAPAPYPHKPHGAGTTAKPLVLASPQSAPSHAPAVAAAKKSGFWPMEFCHDLKRKLFHHGQPHQQ